MFEAATSVHLALVALGFSWDEIFVGVFNVAGVGPAFTVILRAQGLEFVAPIDALGLDVSDPEVVKHWGEWVVTELHPHEKTPQSVMPTAPMLASLLLSLEAKGFKVVPRGKGG